MLKQPSERLNRVALEHRGGPLPEALTEWLEDCRRQVMEQSLVCDGVAMARLQGAALALADVLKVLQRTP